MHVFTFKRFAVVIAVVIPLFDDLNDKSASVSRAPSVRLAAVDHVLQPQLMEAGEQPFRVRVTALSDTCCGL
jgi:hypothetical protein